MKVLVLSDTEVQKALPYPSLIQQMRFAMFKKAEQKVHNPSRYVFELRNGNALGIMPCQMEEAHFFTVKVATVFPGNKHRDLDTHQGLVVLFAAETGQPIAILNASVLTARRTAAMSAAATEVLAARGASNLAVFGAGIQAEEHIAAIQAVRPIQRVRVYCRSQASGEALVKKFPELKIFTSRDISQTLNGAEIICLCTSAKTSYLTTLELPTGCHVNAVGACRPGSMEIRLMDRSELAVYIDDHGSSTLEADEINHALQKGELSESKIKGELGLVFSEKLCGRMEASDITLFKSLGLAVQDHFAAQLAISSARQMGLGVELSF